MYVLVIVRPLKMQMFVLRPLLETGTFGQGCSPKKEVGGTLETRLRQRFLNSLGLHTRTLIHVRKIATADLWSCPAIQLLAFEYL